MTFFDWLDNMTLTSRSFFLYVLLLLSLYACSDKKPATPPGAGAPPPANVAVITVAPEDVANTTELPGRIEAVRNADVRARVGGIVQKRLYGEGSEVRAGAVLYQIDAAPFQAAYNSAEAALARADANLGQVTTRLNRYRSLVDSNAISKQEFDDVLSAQKLAAADVAAAKAVLDNARLNLSYSTITAPIAGRIGRTLVTEGALVTANDPTALAVIQQLDPIYVTLTQSSVELSQLREKITQSGQRGTKIKLTLLTEDGKPYAHAGQFLFSETTVDPLSSSVILRAQFPNPERSLLPGMYVRVKLEQGVRSGTITVPQQAVMRTADGSVVMSVNAEGKVIPKPVKTGGAYGTRWIITSGLDLGDQIIVEGLQKAKPGATVKASPWEPAGAAPTNGSLPTPAAQEKK
ncbi:MAG: efflux RND transporter periplasmic adaptor subunit [Oxalobacteraceae bacterium]|nr:efflux RND transporter periplasmic adaptor subunit [Oxalobacteraceae bacterium]